MTITTYALLATNKKGAEVAICLRPCSLAGRSPFIQSIGDTCTPLPSQEAFDWWVEHQLPAWASYRLVYIA